MFMALIILLDLKTQTGCGQTEVVDVVMCLVEVAVIAPGRVQYQVTLHDWSLLECCVTSCY